MAGASLARRLPGRTTMPACDSRDDRGAPSGLLRLACRARPLSAAGQCTGTVEERTPGRCADADRGWSLLDTYASPMAVRNALAERTAMAVRCPGYSSGAKRFVRRG